MNIFIYLLLLIFLIIMFLFILKLRKEVAKRRTTETALRKSIDELLSMETDLALAKEKAESSSQSKTEFLSNMSHEIRTPMNSVIGFTELLQRTNLDETQKSYVDSIKSSGKNLLSLINDILDLSKIEAGKLSIQKSAFNLESLLKEVQEVFSVDIKKKNLEFMLDFSSSLPNKLYSDEARIRQIILNLVGNAVKFTQKGHVHILVDLVYIDDNYLTLNIYVVDSGIGISKENQERIFHNFEQQKNQDSSFGGTGLGLAICEKLANKLGGKISVNSKVDKGSTFTLSIQKIEYSNEIFVQKKSTKQYIFKESTILLIDENRQNRELIKGILQDQSIMIIEAHNFETALEYLDKVDINLILIDIRNPSKDGDKISSLIKEKLKYKLTPIVSITSSVYDAKQNLKYGFDKIIFKPLEYEVFMDTLAEVLDVEVVGINNDISYELIDFTLEDSTKRIYYDKYYEKIIQQERKNNFKELSELSSEILKFALKYELHDLELTLKNLNQAIKVFDIDMIKKIIHNLKSIAQ